MKARYRRSNLARQLAERPGCLIASFPLLTARQVRNAKSGFRSLISACALADEGTGRTDNEKSRRFCRRYGACESRNAVSRVQLLYAACKRCKSFPKSFPSTWARFARENGRSPNNFLADIRRNGIRRRKIMGNNSRWRSKHVLVRATSPTILILKRQRNLAPIMSGDFYVARATTFLSSDKRRWSSLD